MRAARLVRCLSLGRTREQNESVIAEFRYSRYPLLGRRPGITRSGFVHVKDLLLAEQAGKSTD